MVTVTQEAPRKSAFSFTYSKLSGFETCPLRFYETEILKNWPEERNEYLEWGNAVHAAIEANLTKQEPLPASMRGYQKWIDKVVGTPGELLCEDSGRLAIDSSFKPCAWNSPSTWLRGIADVIKLDEEYPGAALVVDWKGLSIDTPIPTPDGFKTMGDIVVGDLVFSSDGKPYRVTGKSEVKQIPCYRVEFTSGFALICDKEHLWPLADKTVVPVTRLYPGSRLPLPSAVDYPEQPLPIDPYVLGVWLADGKHTSGEVSKPDEEIWAEIQRRGYAIGEDISSKDHCRAHTIYGIKEKLSELGVLGNKHIPDIYLHGSVQTRHALLMGLMDGDGYANKARKQVVMDMTDREMIYQIGELVRSLGERVLITSFSKSGFGRTVTVWRAAWRPRLFSPFTITRKYAVASAFGAGEEFLEVADIVPLPPEPTQCIAVDSPDHTYLCGREYVVTHNTGKPANADPVQLVMLGLLTFLHFPKVLRVRADFVFLASDARTTVVLDRKEASTRWAELMPRVRIMQKAVEESNFPARPNRFCRNWCPVRHCVYNGK